ncbi:MAG TPA: putative baseplate assembly protein [Pyrinomonadaceae bacterium]|nr:putative baseplate assembly protein [Pyrinomonadaceae bacterium]
MSLPASQIDSRKADDIVRQTLELLNVYTAEWQQSDPKFDPDKGASHALLNIFGRLSELVIQRLNHVPDKNLLAFLDMIGASLLPPQSARVPLTFSLVLGSIVDGLVPAGTQVAAIQAQGEPAPVIFETEEELVVTAAQLIALFVRQPEKDSYADNSFLINSVSSKAVAAFDADTQLEHIFYLGHDTLFRYPGLQQLQLDFQAAKPPGPFQAQWEAWDGLRWTKIPASLSAGGAETTDGDKYLTKNGTVYFTSVLPLPQLALQGFEESWLRCRLLTPLSTTTPSPEGTINDNQLPDVTSINMTATIGTGSGETLPIEAAFNNAVQVDTTKDFFPFGESPRVGDALYLASQEAFSEQGSTVTLNIKVTAPGISPDLANVQLNWEFWDGKTWSLLGQVSPTTTSSGQNTSYTDTTKAFTASTDGVATGIVQFTFPARPMMTTINGVENFWIRVRIVNGNYGVAAYYKQNDPNDPSKGYALIASTLKPPSIASISVAYTLTKQSPPQVILAYNDYLDYEEKTCPFKPFQHQADTDPTIFLGFTLPHGLTTFPNRKLSFYTALVESDGGENSSTGNSSDEQLELLWQYWNGTDWSELSVRDYTENLTRPGLIEFLAPPDFAATRDFGLILYWLRVLLTSGEYASPPWLSGVLLNTTMASQAVTIQNETLGSSDASKSQKFSTTSKPILEGQQLDVREPEIPPSSELEKIEADGVESPLRVITDNTGRPVEIYVRWIQKPDFYGSGPRDRHYVLDNLTGEVTFGDGQNGLIPPAGVGNILMTLYRNGGGTAGNKPAGTITQLKTTVPYVEKVVNHLDAGGGTNAETTDSLLDRAPRTLRHGHRAVTVKDYEDLAMLASTEVARAKCIPPVNMQTNEDDADVIRNGTITLIIVPRSADAKPSPGSELLGRVQDFIGEWQSPLATLIVAAPQYIAISVMVDVALTSPDGASEIKLAINQTLSDYLHPLTGGRDGCGWTFGRSPHESNLYALIEEIAGVDHVRSLSFAPSADSETVREAGNYFLVYSGTHTITLRFEEE